MAYGVEGFLEDNKAVVDCSTFPFCLLCYQSQIRVIKLDWASYGLDVLPAITVEAL